MPKARKNQVSLEATSYYHCNAPANFPQLGHKLIKPTPTNSDSLIAKTQYNR